MFDTIVRGGRVIDPAQNLDRVTDVGLIGPRVAAIGADLVSQGVRGAVVDAHGLVVTAGWVDLHTHVYWGVAPLGVEADAHCLRRGVTTAVDAGSAGAATFAGFKRYVIDISATRVLAMLHLSAIGMMRDDTFGAEAIGELEDIRWANVERALEVARAHAEVITGIKIRISEQHVGRNADHTREVLRRARQLADTLGKPVMVHSGRTAIPLDEVLGVLVRGDIVTHVYHARTEGVLDEGSKVRPSVPSAGDSILVGAYMIEGIAFDRAADQGPGIEQISVFLDDRNLGGTLIGHGALGAPSPVPNDPELAGSGWTAQVMLTSRMIGPHTLFFYALSGVTGEELVVTVPVKVTQ